MTGRWWTGHIARALKWAVAAILIWSCLTAAQAQQIWFSPQVPHGSAKGARDWSTMFDPSAPWRNSVGHIAVLLHSQYYIDDTPDQQLVAEFAFMRARNIKIALGVQAITSTPSCPGANEGYGPPRDSARFIAKLKRLGLSLDYVVLDEPLWFGHYDPDPGACPYPPKDLARRVVEIAGLYIAAFPHIEIGEVEPVPVITSHADWQVQYLEWNRAFEAASGRKISFLQTEVHTLDPTWQDQLKQFAEFTRKLGIPFGIIYNSSGPDYSDRDWVGHARGLFEEAESGLGLRPDQAVIQTWDDRPAKIFPETSDEALSYLVAKYILPRTRVAVQQTGGTISGKLLLDSTQGSIPVAGAKVLVEVAGFDPSKPLPVSVGSGEVPAAARSAIIGVRLNVECNCVGENDFLIGALTYKEMQGGDYSVVIDLPASIRPGSTNANNGVKLSAQTLDNQVVAHIVTNSAGRYAYNSVPFPVTPKAHYNFQVPVATAPGSGLSGYATIIWRDANSKGISRTSVWPTRSYRQLESLVTDKDGRFSFQRPVSVTRDQVPLRFLVPESPTYRGAYLNLP